MGIGLSDGSDSALCNIDVPDTVSCDGDARGLVSSGYEPGAVLVIYYLVYMCLFFLCLLVISY